MKNITYTYIYFLCPPGVFAVWMPHIGFRFGFLIGGKPGIASKAHMLKFA